MSKLVIESLGEKFEESKMPLSCPDPVELTGESPRSSPRSGLLLMQGLPIVLDKGVSILVIPGSGILFGNVAGPLRGLFLAVALTVLWLFPGGHPLVIAGAPADLLFLLAQLSVWLSPERCLCCSVNIDQITFKCMTRDCCMCIKHA